MHKYTPIALGIALALGAGLAMNAEASTAAQTINPAIPAMPLKHTLSEFAGPDHL